MLFFLNLDGTVTRSDTDHVYQGQNKVANVELFTLISPAQAAIQVAFTLPNGLTTTYAPMSYVGAYSVDESNQKQVHRWKLAVPYNVTEVEGQVGVSFNVLLNDGTSGETQETINQTTYTSSFTVEYSALPSPPTTATEDELGQLLDLLNLYYTQNASLAAKQPFVVGTVKTNTLGANQQASVAVEQSTTPDGDGNYPTNFTFSIPQGIQGTQGEVGETPDVSAVAEVNNTVGTPSVVVEKSGTKENPVFNFKFSNVKGQQGDPGVGNANLSNTPGTSETDGYTQNAVNGIVQNPNLLINPNFAINQRGQTSYSGNDIYTVDRWLIYGATLTPVSNGVSLECNGNSRIFQRLENNNQLLGKTVTLTFCIDGTTKSASATFPTSVPTSNTNILSTGYDVDGYRLRITYYTTGIIAVLLDCKQTKTCVVNWAKLEIGSVATAFSPPSIAEELIKCQRYFVKIGDAYPFITSGFVTSGGRSYRMSLYLPTTMRTTPSVGGTPTWLGRTANGYSAYTSSSAKSFTSASVAHLGGSSYRIVDTLTEAVGDSNNTIMSYEINDLELDAEI